MTKEFLTVENAEIDFETLRIVQGRGLYMIHQRGDAAEHIVEIILEAASPEDRQRYEAYLKENDPCCAEER